MLSITVIVVIVAAVSGLANVRNEEGKLLGIMTLGADQLSNAIVSATWHAMLDDHREAAYQVMQTIALKQGIDRIRMFNRTGEVRFSTDPRDVQTGAGKASPTCALCHAPAAPKVSVDCPRASVVFFDADGPPPAGDGHPHLQRAIVRPSRVPRASQQPKSAGRARSGPQSGQRRQGSRRHEGPRAAGDGGRDHAHRPVHHLFHQAFRGAAIGS